MRSIVHFVMAMAAAMAGVVHAAVTINAATTVVVEATGQKAGSLAPDVTITPGGAPPVPIPYPNLQQGDKDSQEKLTDKIVNSNSVGDEAGASKGMSKNKNKGEFKNASSNVKTEGKKAVILIAPIRHNASDASAPAALSPTTTRATYRKPDLERAVVSPVKTSPKAPPLPSRQVLPQPPTPGLTPIATPVSPLPVTRLAPVKAPQPVVPMPVQPQPVTLQPQPILRR